MARTCFLILLTLAAPAAAQTPPPMEALRFISGCWQASPDPRGTVLEEIWTTPSANLMLAMTRYLRDGSAVMFEFSRIERSDTAITLTPYPRGTPSVSFRLVGNVEGEAVFENPAHDFPQRIRYRRDGDGLVARIENLAGEGQEWRMMVCP